MPAPLPPLPLLGLTPIVLGSGVVYSIDGKAGNNLTINIAGADTLVGGDGDTLTAAAGGNSLTGHDRDVLTIGDGNNSISLHDSGSVTVNGGGNNIVLHDSGKLTINDTRTIADGYTGSVVFSDTIAVHRNDVVALNYTLSLGASDNVSVDFRPVLTVGDSSDTVNANYIVNAGKGDTITFSGSNETVLLNAGSGDIIATSGANDTITVGGSATTKSSMTIGATAGGTTINGGLGLDTFTAGAGYDGGNYYVGSAHDYADGFSAVGNCANYSSLACRVTVNYQTNTGQGFDAAGNLLWTDTYSNMQQVKAGKFDGNVLTGSDSYYSELKGGLGSATYNGGAAGDRIIWSAAGAAGLNDGQSTDVAFGGAGNDEFYWRNSPGGKGLSNFGEAINGFNVGQGDDLNLSEFANSGFAGVTKAFAGANDLANWVNVSLVGNDTDVWFDKTGNGNFTQLAAVLKNDNLFSDFGVADQSAAGAQQVVQNLYNTGHLVLTQPH